MSVSNEKERIGSTIRQLFSGQIGPVSVPSGAIQVTAGASDADDCAVLRCEGPFDLVVGSDYVRGPKFTLYEHGLLSAYDLGYYLVAANLSDIAAMGASAIGLLTVVRYPAEMSDDDFEQVMQGIHDSCRDHGTQNLGGDIGTAERLILSATAFGAAKPGGALRRSGARVGDIVCVSGPVGDAGAALLYFADLASNGEVLAQDVEQTLLRPWKRPSARLAVGSMMGTRGLATSCQDISDGLRATLEELATASALAFEIHLDAIPVGTGAAAVAELLGLDSCALALSASVDFELAFTVPPSLLDDANMAFNELGAVLHPVGRAVRGVGLQGLRGGEAVGVPGVPWRHQEGDVARTIVEGLGTVSNLAAPSPSGASDAS